MRKRGLIGIIVLTIASLLLSSCTAANLAVSSAAASAAAAPTQQPVQVQYGETVMVDGDKLSITFDEVLEDSRCPLDVMCAWSGWVRVGLTLAQPKADPSVAPTTVAITGFTDSEGVVNTTTNIKDAMPVADYPPYRLTLLKVEPYPASTQTDIADSEYILTIDVQRLDKKSKPQSPPPSTPAPKATATPLATLPEPPFINCPDGMVLPVACVSYKALIETTAGVADQKPVQFSAPTAVCDVPDRNAGDAICAQAFDVQWQIGDSDLTREGSVWYEFTPTDQAYWYWDDDRNAVMPYNLPADQTPTDQTPTDQAPTDQTPTSDAVSVTPNRPFTLQVGQSGVIGDGELTVTFHGVTHDERCPLNAACEVRGAVSVVIELQPAGSSPLAPEFTIETDEGGGILDDTGPTILYGGYTLYILAVRPYPQDINQPIDPDAYVAKLLLSE
jgi:hypothetical protein